MKLKSISVTITMFLIHKFPNKNMEQEDQNDKCIVGKDITCFL